MEYASQRYPNEKISVVLKNYNISVGNMINDDLCLKKCFLEIKIAKI